MEYDLKRPLDRLFFAGDQIKKYSHVESDLILGEPESGIPEYTILIPTYKRPKQLIDAVHSAFKQTLHHSRYEVLVVDNEHDLDSLTCKELEVLDYDNLIYYQNERNLGGIANWNRGFVLARSRWVCMLHDDDILYPNALESIDTILKQLDAPKLAGISPSFDFAYQVDTDWVCAKQSPTHFWREALQNRLIRHSLTRLQFGLRDAPIAPTCGAVFSRAAVLEMGGFPDDYKSDDLFFIFALSAKNLCYSTKQIWGQYRWGNNDSLSEATKVELVKETLLLYDYFLKYPQKGCFSKMEIWLKKRLRYMLCIEPFLNQIDPKFRDIFVAKYCPEWQNYVPSRSEKIYYNVRYLIIWVYDMITTFMSPKDGGYVKNK